MPSPRLDLRKLEQFVAAASAPSLAVAAEQNFITQQALSVGIRSLEREFGVALFDRSRRKLELTRAGRELYDHALPLLSGADHMVTAVRRVAQERPEEFRVGHSPALSGNEAYRLVEPVVRECGDVSVTLRQVYPSRLEPMLLDGDVDMVLRRGVATPESLASAIITYQPLRLAVNATHEWAGRAVVDIAELADRPIVVWAPEHRSFYTDYLVSHCRRAGFDPMLIISRVQGAPPTSAVIYHPQACAFVTDDAGPAMSGDVRVIDFSSPPLVPVQGLWLPHTVSKARSILLAAQSTTENRSPTDV
ncbi:putative LysR family transcriptional regulator [Gordonia effusa NBRC 100432]|uniref:Putative LysR family transcriptional regulator n=1 Tax=Gordonia effusa NBRC 100432 TaxID=1077974 RepID=H0R6T3_9ACTN|nr:LysR family transcriptional regulator [Gordonia effusa]GAB20784.1 putative LysR family transcriptional regulator [Gordonia effusa NBRC 100432]